ncbi:MAG: NifU family protein [Nanoarchaeota archaeon]
MTDDIKAKIEESLEKVRPYLNSEGGDVEFVEFDEENRIVKVRLQGACSHCAISTVTLKMGIEQSLMDDIPEVKGVEQVQ